MKLVTKIVSGGQTGADQGGLDAAIALGLEHGGYCPKGRISEDGPIPAKYKLTETSSTSYPYRTRLNARESDGTVVFVMGVQTRGSQLAESTAVGAGKPCLQIDLMNEPEVSVLREWLQKNDVRVLNVAGTRESKAPGIQVSTASFLVRALW